MNNKEAIAKLKEYFLAQDRETVAYALASAMVDINRFMKLDRLPDKEVESLFRRGDIIVDQLVNFLQHGPSGDLKLVKMNSDTE
jgi:hypothetical protein